MSKKSKPSPKGSVSNSKEETVKRKSKAARKLRGMARSGGTAQLSRLLAMQTPLKKAEKKEADK